MVSPSNTTVDGSEISNKHRLDVLKPVVNDGINYQPQLVLAGFQPSTVPWIRDRRCFSKQRLNFGIATVIQLRLYLLVLPRLFAKVRSFEQEIHAHTHTPKQRQLPCPYYEASAKVFLTLFIYMCCKQLSGTKTVTCSPKNAPTKNPKCRNLRISAVFLKSKIGTSTSLPLMSCFKLSSTACLPKWMGE